VSLVPTDLRQDYYTLSVGGIPFLSPGICEIIGATKPYSWDEQKGFGIAGSGLVGGTRGLSRFSIRHTIFENPGLGPTGLASPQWGFWDLFKVALDPLAIVAPAPFISYGIAHPQLADIGIKSVVIESYSQWTQDAFGIWTMEIKYIEYRTPVRQGAAKAVAGPPGGIVSPGGVDPRFKAELNGALGDFSKAAGGG
jgi:hypothetical protein